MTSATAGVIKFLSGELDAARDEAQKARVVNEQCKPMIRNLAGQYDAEDEEARLEKKLKDYDATAHKKIQEQLFEVRFRGEPGMLRAIQVNYDQVLGASRMSPPLAAAPAPAADIEAPEASEDSVPA